MKHSGINGIIIAVVIIGAIFLTQTKEINYGLDLQGGVYVVLEANAKGEEVTISDMKKVEEVMRRRVDQLGVSEPVIQLNGTDRIIVELAGVNDPDKAVDLIGKTALMEFKIVEGNNPNVNYDSLNPYILGPALMTGEAIANASMGFGDGSMGIGKPEIRFSLTSEGARRFAEITGANRGKQLAIVLDGDVITAPTINGAITGGSGVITGNFTAQSAEELAGLLNAGALPFELNIIEKRTVGASLGEKSIKASLLAAKVAVILIALFMIIFYRVPGLVANVALAGCGLIIFAVLQYFGFVLTLPGIAGLILTAGMAVDANVIIFERIKEELRLGNTIPGAAEQGFNKAFSSIFDSNITTFMIAMILFGFGTGPVKGFAVTLMIGILASMFTAIMVTKFILKTYIKISKTQNVVLFGVKGEAK